MGNNKSKKVETNQIESLLIDTYKNTDLEFSFKEVTSFKLRIHDAQNYFKAKFDYFFYFNNYLFRERLSTLYDNFNTKIEKFSASKQKPAFSVLIDFDDESEIIQRGAKMDFDSLFTIVFEKLEISILLFFDMTNVDLPYIADFFLQLIESVELYKYNRKFDCLYFLLPNTDYFLKNDCALLYVTNKAIHNKKVFFNSDVNDLKNELTRVIFEDCEKEKLLNSRYPRNDANNFIEYFIEKVHPTLIKSFLTFNFNTEVESLILNNEDQLKLLESLVDNSPINIINIHTDSLNNFNLLEMFVKKIVNLQDKSQIEENVFIIKLVLKNKTKSEIKLKNLEGVIKNLIADFTIYNQIQNKRKFIFELSQININHSNSNSNNLNSSMELTQRSSNSVEYTLSYEKMFFYWFLQQKHRLNIDFKLCFGILLRQKMFEKFNNKIIYNIKEMLFTNYSYKYQNETRSLTAEEFKKYNNF